MRSSWETLATKSRWVRSTCSMRVMSCSTATAPPPGIGETSTSKMRPGSSEVERPSLTVRCFERVADALAARRGRGWSGPERGRCARRCRRRRPESAAACAGCVHWMRPAESTATTASCMLSIIASSSRRLSEASFRARSTWSEATEMARARPSKSL